MAAHQVRPLPEATWADLEALASAGDDFTADGLRRWFLEGRLELVRERRAQIWGVLDDGIPVAACFSFTSGGLSRLDQLLVRPDQRRRGLGSIVVAGIRDRLIGSQMIVMEPQTGNWRSRMYRKLGFESAGITVTVLERG
jgi:ribosomal protein S18 acetylase RimI-like enzyme